MEQISEERERMELSPLAEEMLGEMVRLAEEGENGRKNTVRLQELGNEMHLSQPSVARTVQTLSLWQYVELHRFGVAELTEKGREWGTYFRRRQKTARLFFDALVGEENDCDLEKLTRCLSKRTVDAMERYLEAQQKQEEPCAAPNGDIPKASGEP